MGWRWWCSVLLSWKLETWKIPSIANLFIRSNMCIASHPSTDSSPVFWTNCEQFWFFTALAACLVPIGPDYSNPAGDVSGNLPREIHEVRLFLLFFPLSSNEPAEESFCIPSPNVDSGGKYSTSLSRGWRQGCWNLKATKSQMFLFFVLVLIIASFR